jgi:flagellin-like hook-associated protein FlgL
MPISVVQGGLMSFVPVSKYSIPILKNSYFAKDALQKSMRALSSGERINRTGDAPSDFGISNDLAYTIRNTERSLSNLMNAQGALSTSDAWMSSTQDILMRMSELAAGSIDGSKNQNDRDNLQIEFSELQSEIRSIARNAKFNGIQVAGKDSILAYDNNLETFVFSQPDGSITSSLPKRIVSGLTSSNGLDYLFDGTQDYTLSQKGNSIFYVDDNQDLVRYSIEEDTLARDSNDTGSSKTFDVDEQGRLWYLATTDDASFTLKQQNITQWAQDTDIVGDGDITDIGTSQFSVYEDFVYYVQKDTNNVVRRSLYDSSKVEIMLNANDYSYNTNNFSISEDGSYLVDVSATTPSEVRVTNLSSKQNTTFQADPEVVATNVRLSADNNEVFFLDSTSQDLRRIMLTPGKEPSLSGIELVLESENGVGFSGFSVEGGSHEANFRVHDGPEASQEYFVSTGDMRLFTLGISNLSVSTILEGRESLGKIKNAIQQVSLERAKTGSSFTHLSQSYESLSSYEVQLNMAFSNIRDTDIAEESARLAALRLLYETSLSLTPHANGIAKLAASLLRN